MGESHEAEIDRAYESGRRQLLIEMLGQAGFSFGDDPKADVARMTVERLRAVAALRELCAEFGDNDWPDNLSLEDVIEKHLVRHLRK